MIIDERGTTWADNDARLYRSLGATPPGEKLDRYVVDTFGWISVRPRRHAFEITCSPKKVSPQALAELLYFVHDEPKATISLRLRETDATDYVLRDRPTFVRLISGLIEGGQQKGLWSGPRHLVRPRAQKASPFGAAVQSAMQASQVAMDVAAMTAIFEPLFNGRWGVCEVRPDRGDVVVRHNGLGFTPFNPGWVRSAPGRNMAEYADVQYGKSVAETYSKVLGQPTPYFDDVDAVTDFKAIGSVRLRYTRLMLPIANANGPPLVLSACASDSAIDLRRSA